MLQSNALTVPPILLTSISLSLVQPRISNSHIFNAMNENTYCTMTVGEDICKNRAPINKNAGRDAALKLFGHQSNLTVEERRLSEEALRNNSIDTGMNVFDLYKKRIDI